MRRAGFPEKPPLPLPGKPSIAVLPFSNLTGDEDQDFFVDGFTNEIITELSRFSELFVIARNSSFQYRGKAKDVRDIASELGVHYVLEGSQQKAGDRLRVNFTPERDLKDAYLDGRLATFKQTPDENQEDVEGEALAIVSRAARLRAEAIQDRAYSSAHMRQRE